MIFRGCEGLLTSRFPDSMRSVKINQMKQIPKSFQKYFWDTNFAKINLKKHKIYIELIIKSYKMGLFSEGDINEDDKKLYSIFIRKIL